MGLGNLNDPPSPMTRPCRPNTLFMSNNNQVGHRTGFLLPSWELFEITMEYILLLSSLTHQTMKLDVSAVHMVSTLI